MRALARLLGLVILIPSVAAVFLLLNVRVATRVSLSGGEELRILKVGQGTNHVFSHERMRKQALRRVFPGASNKLLGAPQMVRVLTHHDSLVIWVDKVHPTSGRSTVTKAEHFEAMLPDGGGAKGEVSNQPGGIITAIEFSYS